jgi:hypothetical protein
VQLLCQWISLEVMVKGSEMCSESDERDLRDETKLLGMLAADVRA